MEKYKYVKNLNLCELTPNQILLDGFVLTHEKLKPRFVQLYSLVRKRFENKMLVNLNDSERIVINNILSYSKTDKNTKFQQLSEYISALINIDVAVDCFTILVFPNDNIENRFIETIINN